MTILRFQNTFKIVLPLFLVCDMVHSCYYVTRLYKRRIQVESCSRSQRMQGILPSNASVLIPENLLQKEWREEDEAELRAGLSAVMQKIAAHCARNDSTVWPPSVSARMHLPMPEPQGPANAMTAAALPAAAPVKLQGSRASCTDDSHDPDMLAGLGLSCW